MLEQGNKMLEIIGIAMTALIAVSFIITWN